jgi:uncharacterized protein (TIGR02646 family)
VIRIHKSKTIPDRLLKQGKAKQKEHCTDYERNPEAYRSGEKKFNFDSTIYAHDSVKQILIQDQYGKCCYCERVIHSEGEVEHFRPKGSVHQIPGAAPQNHGYYWLAYDWYNLYLACSACNRYKKSHFPLKDAVTRAKSHKDKIEHEVLNLIEPGQDDPTQAIRFEGPESFPITDAGQTTIELLRLNRQSLQKSRLNYLQKLKLCHQMVKAAHQYPDNLELQRVATQAIQLLDNAIKPDSEFASAIQHAIDTDFVHVASP